MQAVSSLMDRVWDSTLVVREAMVRSSSSMRLLAVTVGVLIRRGLVAAA